MYLSEFTNGKTQNAIIDLCLYSAETNGDIDEREIKKIKEFCSEMNTEFYDIPKSEMETALTILYEECSMSERKKILMELLALMMSDGSCDEEEMNFLKEQVIKKLEITDEDLSSFYKALRQLYMIYANINQLVS